jgi:hypothetical protein
MTDTERGLVLAQRLQQIAAGEESAVVTFAGCWLLASVLVQALEDRDEPIDPVYAVQLVSAQFGHCVSELMAARQATKQ